MRFKVKKYHSANIQAEIYHQCRLEGIDCYLEYSVGGCRFDLITIKDGDIISIIECKSYLNPKKRAKINTVQLEKYRRFGVPVLVAVRMDDVEKTIKEIKRLHGLRLIGIRSIVKEG